MPGRSKASSSFVWYFCLTPPSSPPSWQEEQKGYTRSRTIGSKLTYLLTAFNWCAALLRSALQRIVFPPIQHSNLTSEGVRNSFLGYALQPEAHSGGLGCGFFLDLMDLWWP